MPSHGGYQRGAYFSVTLSDFRAPTETVPSENPHVDVALAAPTRSSSDDAIEKRMVGDLWLWLKTTTTLRDVDSLKELGVDGYVVVGGAL